MYNRYIRSEADEIPFSSSFIPVSHVREDYMNDRVSSEENTSVAENKFNNDTADIAESEQAFKENQSEDRHVETPQQDQKSEVCKICEQNLDEKKIVHHV